MVRKVKRWLYRHTDLPGIAVIATILALAVAFVLGHCGA